MNYKIAIISLVIILITIIGILLMPQSIKANIAQSQPESRVTVEGIERAENDNGFVVLFAKIDGHQYIKEISSGLVHNQACNSPDH